MHKSYTLGQEIDSNKHSRLKNKYNHNV